MSIGNIWLAKSSDKANILRFPVKAGGVATITAGEPVIVSAADSNYVGLPAADVTSGDRFVGIAVSSSDETASVNGHVYVAVPTAGTTYRGKAKTKANLASTVLLTKVVIDLTSGVFTIDESTTTNGICLLTDYNSTTGEVDFMVDMSGYVNA